jgi:hypothetical protein
MLVIVIFFRFFCGLCLDFVFILDSLVSSQGAQNKKTGPDAPCTAENECGSAKRENGT